MPTVRQNQIVLRYAQTDADLLRIAQTAPESETLPGRALIQLEECLAGRRLARDAIRLAESVPMDQTDPQLLLLILGTWAEICCRIGKPADAEALVHRAGTLVTENTVPEIRAHIIRVESIIADIAGNKKRREEILKQIASVLGPRSPRYKFHLWDLIFFLAQHGRAAERQEDIRTLESMCNEHFRKERIALVKFFNALETGNAIEALQLLPQIETSPHLHRSAPQDPVVGYQALLAMMADRTPRRFPAMTSTAPTWVRVIRALLARDPDEALRLARLDASRHPDALFAAGFHSFNLVRAELAAGNWDAARRLLEMRRERGSCHPMEDFFAARVCLLSGDRNQAADIFARLARRMASLNARPRLGFELDLAVEMKGCDLLDIISPQAAHEEPLAAQQERPSAQTTDRPSASPSPIDSIIGFSESTRTIRELVSKFADLDAPVLITGETGTGKEVVARALHLAGKRADKPFIAVNCGSIAETILESELFGHERGAFTGADRATKGLFEDAGEGTIFLDEIGEIPPHLQRALLRVLETGEIRAVGSTRTRKIQCRILAATNADLESLAREDRFRKDLLFRLQRLGIHIPPLRERREDILPLAQHFLDMGRRPGLKAELSQEAKEVLLRYDWPGNVRELRNVIERMRLMHSDKLSYGVQDMDIKFRPTQLQTAAQQSIPPPSETWRQPADEADTRVPQEELDRVLVQGSSSLRRLERLRALFRKHQKLTRGEIMRILRISPNTATKDLKILCEEGLIERVEPSSSTRTHYFRLASGIRPETGQ